jgi:hypothetical protein
MVEAKLDKLAMDSSGLREEEEGVESKTADVREAVVLAGSRRAVVAAARLLEVVEVLLDAGRLLLRVVELLLEANALAKSVATEDTAFLWRLRCILLSILSIKESKRPSPFQTVTSVVSE